MAARTIAAVMGNLAAKRRMPERQKIRARSDNGPAEVAAGDPETVVGTRRATGTDTSRHLPGAHHAGRHSRPRRLRGAK